MPFLVTLMVNNPPAMRVTTGSFTLDWEDLLEKGMLSHSSILASRPPWTRESGRLWSMQSQRSDTIEILILSVFKTQHLYVTVLIVHQFSLSVGSDSLWSHEAQHSRPPCPSTTPGVHLNTCPSSRWCHLAISSSLIHLSSCPHPSQHQNVFQWVNSSHEVAKVLEFQL